MNLKLRGLNSNISEFDFRVLGEYPLSVFSPVCGNSHRVARIECDLEGHVWPGIGQMFSEEDEPLSVRQLEFKFDGLRS